MLLPLNWTSVGVTWNGPEKDTGAHDGHKDGEDEGSKSQGRHGLQSATFGYSIENCCQILRSPFTFNLLILIESFLTVLGGSLYFVCSHDKERRGYVFCCLKCYKIRGGVVWGVQLCYHVSCFYLQLTTCCLWSVEYCIAPPKLYKNITLMINFIKNWQAIASSISSCLAAYHQHRTG